MDSFAVISFTIFVFSAFKSGETPADKGIMAYSSLPPRVTESKAEIHQTRSSRRPEAALRPEWFTGLAVSPASFSRQLSDMQVAMQRAARSAKTQ